MNAMQVCVGGAFVACGGAGQPCCGQNACANNGCCNAGTCVAAGANCGALGNNETCGANQEPGSCGGCGGVGEGCCDANINGVSDYCTAAGTGCRQNSCQACGDAGEVCCEGYACKNGGAK